MNLDDKYYQVFMPLPPAWKNGLSVIGAQNLNSVAFAIRILLRFSKQPSANFLPESHTSQSILIQETLDKNCLIIPMEYISEFLNPNSWTRILELEFLNPNSWTWIPESEFLILEVFRPEKPDGFEFIRNSDLKEFRCHLLLWQNVLRFFVRNFFKQADGSWILQES